jgi:hypothetical protein
MITSLPHNQRNWMPAYASIIFGATTFLLGIRLFTRFQGRGGSFGVDDVFITIAWALLAAMVALLIIGKTRATVQTTQV